MGEDTEASKVTAAQIDEARVAAGTRLLSAEECAERLGMKGRPGVVRLREQTAAGIVQGIIRNGRYSYHWPTVIQSLHERRK